MKTSIYTTVSALALMIGMPAVAQTLPTANYPAEPAECATAGNNCSTVTVRLLPRLVALDVFDSIGIIEIGVQEVVPYVG